MPNDQPAPADPGSPFIIAGAEAYRWTMAAFDLLEQHQLDAGIERRGQQRRVTATGECPNCHHDVAFDHVDRVQAPVERSLGSDTSTAATWESAEVRCSCQHPHAGRPDHIKTGCGIAFTIECRPNLIP